MVELRAALQLPRHPIQVVASLGRLRFDDTLLLNVPELPAIVICTAVWAEAMKHELARRPWIQTVAMGDAHDLSSGFRILRALGISRVSAIGGRTIAKALSDAGLIHDVYLTTSARPGGEPDTGLTPALRTGRLVVTKHGTGPETGVLFEHRVIGASTDRPV
jgi:riboflavin biosynthesis pyrimidine reductase